MGGQEQLQLKMPWAFYFFETAPASSSSPSLSLKSFKIRKDMFFFSFSCPNVLPICSLETPLFFFSGQHSWFMVQELIEGLLCEAMVYVIQGEIIGYPWLGYCFLWILGQQPP